MGMNRLFSPAATRVRLKICGLTQPDNALGCVAAGAQAIGLVFHPQSPRHLEFDQARAVTRAINNRVPAWGVFVDQSFDTIMETVAHCRLDVVQLHGNEPPKLVARLSREGLGVVKALFGAKPPFFSDADAYPDVDAFLVEYGKGPLPGGNAETWDYGMCKKLAREKGLILAGGLGKENIAEAITQVGPAAVDLSSSVETSYGVKDIGKLKALAAALASPL